jgi:type II secretory pathway pseudopilin PulG
MTERKDSMRGRAHSDDGGYILAVLLIAMAVAAVWMSASLPAWRQQAQRERELELRFRGEQYARAVALYFLKNGTLPSDIDTLVSQRFLRKKWKDPITGEDFVPVLNGQAQGTQGGNNRGPGSTTQGLGGRPPGQTGSPGPIGSAQQGLGGITGVMSKSTAASIIIYNNQQEYDLWAFNYQAACMKIIGRACTPAGLGNPAGGGPAGGRPGGGRPGGGAPGGGGPAGGRPGGVGPGGGGPAGGGPGPIRPGGGRIGGGF